jgi:hypothetical protein
VLSDTVLTGAGPRHVRTWPAALTLFLVAGLIPETVATFNSPPRLLLTRPVVFLFISAFYGSVALLVREYMRRRPCIRWAGVLLLGMAAGAVNEGIIAGTWYKAQYPGYAMISGLDPAVAVGLTVFHALVSTVLPIFLVELMFPAIAGRRWLRPPGLCTCLVLLSATAATGFGPPADRGQKLVVLAGVVAAVVVALALAASGPEPASLPPLRPVPTVSRLRLAGAAATVTFYALFAFVPGAVAAAIAPAGRGPWQLLLIVLMAGFFWAVVDIGRDWASRPGWGHPETLAIITGALLPTIIASVVVPAALRSLEPLVTVPMLGLLVWLSRRQRHAARLAAGCG